MVDCNDPCPKDQQCAAAQQRGGVCMCARVMLLVLHLSSRRWDSGKQPALAVETLPPTKPPTPPGSCAALMHAHTSSHKDTGVNGLQFVSSAPPAGSWAASGRSLVGLPPGGAATIPLHILIGSSAKPHLPSPLSRPPRRCAAAVASHSGHSQRHEGAVASAFAAR